MVNSLQNKSIASRLLELFVASLIGAFFTLGIAYISVGASMLNEADVQRISRMAISDSLSVIVERAVSNAIKSNNLITEAEVKLIVIEESPWINDKVSVMDKLNDVASAINNMTLAINENTKASAKVAGYLEGIKAGK